MTSYYKFPLEAARYDHDFPKGYSFQTYAAVMDALHELIVADLILKLQLEVFALCWCRKKAQTGMAPTAPGH